MRDVSLTVSRGELVAIIGSSGSGKATLLGAMSGLRAPTSGTVLRHVQDNAEAAGGPRPGPAGYVPAGNTLHPVLPLARALGYTAELRGGHGTEAATGQVLGLTGLAATAAVPVGRLNQGERKRAAIAAALLARPAQLFLDEPTAGLDPAQAAEVLRLLRELSRGGLTVLLTTSSPLDAARCDKVAVLAAGGHLAFFGTPAAARGYFGADSLEEIYERLAGLGDPAAAWSRRFFHFSRTRAGFTPAPTTPRAPGPTVLVPDAAGPHSAGRPGPAFPGVPPDPDNSAADKSAAEEASAEESAEAGESPSTAAGLSLAGGPALRPLRPAGQLPVLARRNAEVIARARRTQAVLAGVPVAIMLAFCVLLGAGALDGRAAVTLAWAVLGGLAAGLAYELPARGTEAGMLRGEASSGLSTAAFTAAKATVLLPLLAVADALILTVPAAAGRLPGGFGPAYLATAVASVLGLAAALAVVVVTARR